MHGLEAEYWGKVDFIYLDVDNSNNWGVIRQRFNNSNTIPRFYIIDPNGTILYEWIGAKTARDTRPMLNWAAERYPKPTLTLEQSQHFFRFFDALDRIVRIFQLARANPYVSSTN